jgi:NitT/TauT family transport system substrate-binding protein
MNIVHAMFHVKGDYSVSLNMAGPWNRPRDLGRHGLKLTGWKKKPWFGLRCVCGCTTLSVRSAPCWPGAEWRQPKTSSRSRSDSAADGSKVTRYVRAFRETLDLLYSSPDAIKAYAAWPGLPERLARQAPDFLPQDQTSIDPSRVAGLDGMMTEAIQVRIPIRPSQQ